MDNYVIFNITYKMYMFIFYIYIFKIIFKIAIFKIIFKHLAS